jgi:SAM-dependent methyltransferase
MKACTSAECNFALDYELGQSPVMRDIERKVRGTDYGATSWATPGQVRQSVARLALRPGVQLLDIGAGAGWPALFLAALSGCDVVLTDVPLSGLRVAGARAASDGILGQCKMLAADGSMLPFPDRSFERIHHADVLCCTKRKPELLRECRRIARDDARMEFSVIFLAREPLSDDEHRVLEQSGPPYPDAGEDYGALLAKTGWNVLERIDVTAEFSRCINVLLDELDARRADLIQLVGEEDYAGRVQNRQSTEAAISRGLLRREILLVSPQARSPLTA